MRDIISDILNNHPIISDMITKEGIRIVLENLKEVLDNNVKGEIVEFGCYCGTTSLFIRRFLDSYKSKKKFFVYDSFQGLGEKSINDIGFGEFRIMLEGNCKSSKEELIKNFNEAKLKLPIIHESWFKDIVSEKLPKKIAFAFFDGDFYNAIIESFEKVYPLLSPNARVVIDDYQHDGKILPGVKIACDEFLKGKPEEGRVFVKDERGILIKE